eukprot:5488507-Pyramimonas_sp.AAC.1
MLPRNGYNGYKDQTVGAGEQQTAERIPALERLEYSEDGQRSVFNRLTPRIPVKNRLEDQGCRPTTPRSGYREDDDDDLDNLPPTAGDSRISRQPVTDRTPRPPTEMRTPTAGRDTGGPDQYRCVLTGADFTNEKEGPIMEVLE